MPKFIVSGPHDRITLRLCEYLGVDPNVIRRIVVDLEVGSAARIYYETFADDGVLDVALGGLLVRVDPEGESRIVGVGDSE